MIAVILTAGRSSRMGMAKARLHLDGVPLLRILVETCAAAAASEIRVVVAPRAEGACVDRRAAEALLENLPPPTTARLCFFEGATEGTPIDSLRRALTDWPAAPLLLWPIDQPFCDAATLRRLTAALAPPAHSIALPVHAGRRGHPVLFAAALVDELRSVVADQGARGVVRLRPERVVEVVVEESRTGLRLDTPEAARAAGLSL